MRNRLLVLVLLACILSSCTEQQSLARYATIPLYSTLKTAKAEEAIAVEYSYRFIPLETLEEALVGQPVIMEMKDSVMMLKEENILYSFDLHSGKFLSKLDKRGSGPYEYLRIGDVMYSPNTKRLCLFDDVSSRMIIYSDDGTPISEIKNDSIASVGMNSLGQFIVTYWTHTHKGQHLVGVYDKDFSYLTSFINNDSDSELEVNLHKVNPVYTFNGDSYVYVQDSLCSVTEKGVKTVLFIDKGKYKIPDEVESNVARGEERDKYIWGDYGYLVNDCYYYSFNYNNKVYFDVWNVQRTQLIARRVINDYRETAGIPFDIDGNIIYLWPRYVNENKIYCILDAAQASLISSDYNEYEDNPIVLEVTML